MPGTVLGIGKYKTGIVEKFTIRRSHRASSNSNPRPRETINWYRLICFTLDPEKQSSPVKISQPNLYYVAIS